MSIRCRWTLSPRAPVALGHGICGRTAQASIGGRHRQSRLGGIGSAGRLLRPYGDRRRICGMRGDRPSTPWPTTSPARWGDCGLQRDNRSGSGLGHVLRRLPVVEDIFQQVARRGDLRGIVMQPGAPAAARTCGARSRAGGWRQAAWAAWIARPRNRLLQRNGSMARPMVFVRVVGRGAKPA